MGAAQTGVDMVKQAKNQTEQDGLRQLLLGTARGDSAAFEALYAATRGKIFLTAFLILRRRDLAEEVMQEAYVRIWRMAAKYDPGLGSPIAWMTTVARNLAINVLRRPQLEVATDELALLEVPDDGPSALEEIEHAQDQGKALAALRRLDATSQHLIIAAYIHGESRESLSARFGVPVNTVKTWIRRGLLRTRASLAPDTHDRPRAA